MPRGWSDLAAERQQKCTEEMNPLRLDADQATKMARKTKIVFPCVTKLQKDYNAVTSG